jgi:hypothetical protein
MEAIEMTDSPFPFCVIALNIEMAIPDIEFAAGPVPITSRPPFSHQAPGKDETELVPPPP